MWEYTLIIISIYYYFKTFNRFKGTYRSLREKGNSLLKSASNKTETNCNNNEKSKETKDKSSNSNVVPQQLTQSESRRNIGKIYFIIIINNKILFFSLN